MKAPIKLKISDLLSEQDQFRVLAIVAKHIRKDYREFMERTPAEKDVAVRCYDPMFTELHEKFLSVLDSDQCRAAVMNHIATECAKELLATMKTASDCRVPIDELFDMMSVRLSDKLNELVVI